MALGVMALGVTALGVTALGWVGLVGAAGFDVFFDGGED